MGKLLIIKVTDKQRGVSCEYHNKVNLNDPNLISLVLDDLRRLGAPIIKAYKILMENDKIYPFSP